MILIDTNIFIEYYRGNQKIKDILDNISAKSIALSDITRCELYYGAFNKSELNFIRKSLNGLAMYPVNSDISGIAVNLIETYCLSHKLNLPDAYIATTALYHDVEIFTLNRKDFVYIPNQKFYEPSC